MKDITITLNGDSRAIPSPTTLGGLLAQLELDPRAVVVELNREIVRRPHLDDTMVTEGDVVEVVHFVGGG